MRQLLKPRNAVAVLAAIAAGLIVWMAPPLPEWSITTSPGTVVNAVSCSGDYLATTGRADARRLESCVWHRDGTRIEHQVSRLEDSTAGASWAHFAPDESSVVFVVTENLAACEVRRVPLSPDGRAATWQLLAGDVFYSPAGELHYISDGKVRSVEDPGSVKPLPRTVDGFTLSQQWSLRERVLYTRDAPAGILVYDALAGKELSRIKISGQVNSLSRDGQVALAIDDQGKHVIADASGSGPAPVSLRANEHVSALTPNGELLVSCEFAQRPDWQKKWWPWGKTDILVRLIDRRSGSEHAQFHDATGVEFSTDNSFFAVVRYDGVIDVYAWPLRPPWVLLAGASLGAAVTVWSIGWLWTRWRARRLRVEAPRETPA